MAEWRWVAGTASNQQELANAKTRSITWSVDKPATASCSLNGRSAAATVIDELATDLWGYRNGDLVFRGRIGPSNDNVDATVHTVGITAADYREWFARRMLFDGDTHRYLSEDVSDICWDLIQTVQARTGGDMGVTRGGGQTTGVTRSFDFEYGSYISPNIDALAELDDGFEWEIDQYLRFNIYYPRRGSDAGLNFDYGGNVASLTRSFAPEGFMNSGRFSGDSKIAAQQRDADDFTRYGRWEKQVSYPGLTSPTNLALRADADIALGQIPPVAWNLTLQKNGWGGPAHFGHGDLATLRVKSGRLDETNPVRIMELKVDIDDSGNETVSLVVERYVEL